MWIVRLALRRPYTFVVMALVIAVLGVAAIVTMTVYIFPSINIPVVTVIWNYSGLAPTEMQNRIVTVTERAFTTTVNGIEHIESVSLRGVAITRLYFHPNVPIEAAIAQVNRSEEHTSELQSRQYLVCRLLLEKKKKKTKLGLPGGPGARSRPRPLVCRHSYLRRDRSRTRRPAASRSEATSCPRARADTPHTHL